METNAQKHLRIYEAQKSARAALDAYFQELMYYGLPRKAYITKAKSLGDRIATDIYDSTAILSNAYFAAGMQAYMSSPQTKWFSIAIQDQKFMSKQPVLDYLRDVEDVLYAEINNSNFYQEDVEGYLGLGTIGTDILYGEEDITEGLRFDCLSIEDVIIMMDAQGRVNRAYIEYEFDAEQALGKFGKAAGTKVIEYYSKSDFSTKFRYVFGVYPRDVFDQSKKDAKNMPYAAVWIDKETKTIVRESGYREFPFFVSRFAKSKGSPYGYSPLMNVLPDVKMLNQMEYTNILGAQMSVMPPLEIPDEAFLRPFNFNPGGKNIRNTGYPNEHIVPINTGSRVDVGIEYLQYKQKVVQQTFYNDLFLAIEQIGQMTATEVQIRNNQRMQMLGSAIGNIMREKLSPVIQRQYAVAARQKKLPKLPPELNGQSYVINYISPLARAQKALELQNLSQAMQIIGQFAQIQIAGGMNPDVLDNIDFDQATDYVADITNITPKLIRDDSEVEELRQTRNDQNAQAQQLAMLKQGAETAKLGGEADRAIAESQQPIGVR